MRRCHLVESSELLCQTRTHPADVSQTRHRTHPRKETGCIFTSCFTVSGPHVAVRSARVALTQVRIRSPRRLSPPQGATKSLALPMKTTVLSVTACGRRLSAFMVKAAALATRASHSPEINNHFFASSLGISGFGGRGSGRVQTRRRPALEKARIHLEFCLREGKNAALLSKIRPA